MKVWLRKVCSRGDDLVRLIAVSGIAVFLLFLFVINPIYEGVRQKVVFARYEKARAKSEEEFEEWSKQTDDEKFAWCVMDMAKENDTILGVDIYINADTIYIKCLTDKTKTDDLSNEKEYVKIMTEFARASRVTKAIFLRGLDVKGEVAWMIDEYGNVF